MAGTAVPEYRRNKKAFARTKAPCRTLSQKSLCDQVKDLAAPVIIALLGAARFFLLLERKFLRFTLSLQLLAAFIRCFLAGCGRGAAWLRLFVTRARFLLLLGDIRLLLDL